MYCSACGAAVAQGLSYCNYCGARLGEAAGGDHAGSSDPRPEFLVSAMVGLFVLGLVAIAVLVGVLKAVAAFDLPILVAVTAFSFLLLILVESLLVGLLLKSRRGGRKAADALRPKEQTTKGLGEPQPRTLPEPAPAPSVTEHTTRTLESVPRERAPTKG